MRKFPERIPLAFVHFEGYDFALFISFDEDGRDSKEKEKRLKQRISNKLYKIRKIWYNFIDKIDALDYGHLCLSRRCCHEKIL